MARRARAHLGLALAALLLAALPAGAKQAAVVSRDGDLWLGAPQLAGGTAGGGGRAREPAPAGESAGVPGVERLAPGDSWEDKTRDDGTPAPGPRELLP